MPLPRILVRHDPIMGRSIWFYVVGYAAGDVARTGAITHVGDDITMRPVDEGSQMPPTFTLDAQDAQDLIDQLWRIGLRPAEASFNGEAFAAQGAHLQDMRRLVFERRENG